MPKPSLANFIALPDPAAPNSPVHFWLLEFASRDGLVCLHPHLLMALYRLRAALCEHMGCSAMVRITSGTRTPAENTRLAERLGWTNSGGSVSRDSKHLPKYGGIAVDLIASLENPPYIVPKETLVELATAIFDYVKSDYPDGHVHVDMRDSAT
jgi:hypothetical protein